MERDDLSQRLSRIDTIWSEVIAAHGSNSDAVSRAQQALVQRYHGAVYRYILGAVRDANAADDLSQEFALRFVRGDFKRAAPERGRFRDYVKTALFHLIVDHQKRRQAQAKLSALEDPDAAQVEELSGDDEAFLKRWRDELLNRAWEALAEVERLTGQPLHAVLRLRAHQPDLPSPRMAETLSERLGRPITAVGIRQTLHRAREKYADFLLEEVARSLETTDPDRLEQELIDLGLLSYCRSALARQPGRAGK
jgi:RNA polymerase sigma-70 factor (ECF subfamily)